MLIGVLSFEILYIFLGFSCFISIFVGEVKRRARSRPFKVKSNLQKFLQAQPLKNLQQNSDLKEKKIMTQGFHFVGLSGPDPTPQG